MTKEEAMLIICKCYLCDYRKCPSEHCKDCLYHTSDGLLEIALDIMEKELKNEQI